MASLPLYRYIILDGKKYPIASDSYVMKWSRAFSSQLAGNIVRLNFVDRGPGIRVYDMTLILETWAPGSQPYVDGITDAWDVQLQALEASYGKIAKVLQFKDPFGRSPDSSIATNGGVFFTNLSEIIPKYTTYEKAIILCEIEVTEATQVVA